MAKALVAARAGFRRLFSISAFTPPPPATVPPPAEPSPNLFVSGLSKRTTSEGLREAFSKFGNLLHARVVTDRVSGYSKGFGFVRYATVEEAAEGIKGMDGKFLDGWVIFAEYAKPRPPPPQDQSPPSMRNTSSSPPSNYYASQTSQSWSNDPLPNYSSFTPQGSQPPSNYSHYSPQTQWTPPPNSSVPSSNYSSEPPPPPPPPPPASFASTQATNYSQATEFQQGYAGNLPTWSPPGESQPSNYTATNYASAFQNSYPVNSDMRSENLASDSTLEPSLNFDKHAYMSRS